MTSSSTDVLIIGAGPTGLMLGCQLSLYSNVSFRIIDKNPSCTTQSRALVVHARSLELFAQLNLVEKAILQGTCADSINGFFQGQRRIQIDFARIRAEQRVLLTRYPYVLFLEQSATEQMLETFLNEHHVKVERQSEAIDVVDLDSIDGTGVQVTLSNGDIIRTKYVCACDGAKSIVRHKLNLPFSGRTYSESLVVADCKVDNVPIGRNEAAIFCEWQVYFR
jgi:2-polyprenyl-6-methoxyphenol hydroxylase-like FAD-dependent oxidoreductase